jgi:hypothetical protein
VVLACEQEAREGDTKTRTRFGWEQLFELSVLTALGPVWPITTHVIVS